MPSREDILNAVAGPRWPLPVQYTYDELIPMDYLGPWSKHYDLWLVRDGMASAVSYYLDLVGADGNDACFNISHDELRWDWLSQPHPRTRKPTRKVIQWAQSILAKHFSNG